jgi:hypothetical protein
MQDKVVKDCLVLELLEEKTIILIFKLKVKTSQDQPTSKSSTYTKIESCNYTLAKCSPKTSNY